MHDINVVDIETPCDDIKLAAAISVMPSPPRNQQRQLPKEAEVFIKTTDDFTT